MVKRKMIDASNSAATSATASASMAAEVEALPSLKAAANHQMHFHFPAPSDDIIKNRVPVRVFCYRNDNWKEFPAYAVKHIRDRFQAERGRLEVRSQMGTIVLDFIDMVVYDIKNVSKKPLAWVDDKGHCFFPVLPLGPARIESKHFVIMPAPIQLRAPMNPAFVKNMLVLRMVDYMRVEVADIQCMHRINRQTRAEIFEQYVRMVKHARGNPNVQYGWLPTDKRRLDNAMTTLAGFPGKFGASAYGFGAQLTPLDRPYVSATDCDVHENGVRYILFCRLILGSVEEIDPGSQQVRPSTKEFDTGVDNLLHPGKYIIWHDKMDTFIFPEYVITYRLQDRTVEDMATEPVDLRIDGPTEECREVVEDELRLPGPSGQHGSNAEPSS